MSIRLRMVVGIMVVFLLGTLSLGFFLWQSSQVRVAGAANDALKSATMAFARLEKAETTKLSSTLVGLETNSAFRDPYLAGDREALNAAAQPIFGRLKAEHRITHWYFESLPESGTVFLRVHKPEQFGDALQRQAYLAASKAETQSAGLELGKTAVALRVVRPFYGADRALIGYMELGQEIDTFLEEVKAQTGHEVGLLLLKKNMDAAGWAEVRSKRNLEDNWDAQEDFVLAGSTSEELTAEIVKTESLGTVGESGEVFGVFDGDNGATMARGAFPLNDAAGKRIGLVYIQHDISQVVDDISTTRAGMMAAIVAMMIIVLAVVLLLMNGLIFSRLKGMIADMEAISVRVAGGDYDVSYTPTGRADEIGEFERFYGNFISMVGAALKQLSESMKK